MRRATTLADDHTKTPGVMEILLLCLVLSASLAEVATRQVSVWIYLPAALRYSAVATFYASRILGRRRSAIYAGGSWPRN